MKQAHQHKQEQKQAEHTPVQPTGVTELTECDLELMQGGFGAVRPLRDAAKVPPGPAQ